MVPGKGLEPPHLAAIVPETIASTNFATRAMRGIIRSCLILSTARNFGKMTFMRRKTLFPRGEDPFLKRESRLYENPLPSREYIQTALRKLNRPVFWEELLSLFGILDKEEGDFLRRLNAMAQSAQILRNRKGAYLLPDRADLIAGVVEGHKDGFGFCVTEGGDSIFLNVREMKSVLPGDKVLVQAVLNPKFNKKEGKIVEVVERRKAPIVGRVFTKGGVAILLPLDKTITHEILLNKKKAKFEKNALLTVEIVDFPTRHSPPVARVVEVLGKMEDEGIEIKIALAKFNLPVLFSQDAQKEVLKIKENIPVENRVDLRHLPFITIDGEDSKDFDDAVYAEKKEEGFILWVAIADVAHYVLPKSALDKEARTRGNSVYFPRQVIPMLPEKLSNNLCSLVPQKDRLVLVCKMEIGKRGKIKNYCFFEGVIRSFSRMTYEKVFAYFQNQHAPDYIQNLYAVYNALKIARQRRFALDFDLKESQIIFNQQNKIERIIMKKRNVAHSLIEECMLAANVCASDYLKKEKSLYRIHENPKPKKIEELNAFLKYFNLKLNPNHPSPKDYVLLLKEMKNQPIFEIVQPLLLKSLQKAVYSVDNLGHFGLAYASYTHFTSPIRRYPDLIIHRLIKAKLNQKKYETDLENIALHSSFTEKEAEEASREVEAYLKCAFMQNKIGEIFEGTISYIAHFGVFVVLDSIFVEGLIHISELGEDYFHFEPHKMVGENTGKIFYLGMRLKVKLVRVNQEELKIDFVPVLNEKIHGQQNKISKKNKVLTVENKIKKYKKGKNNGA